MGTLQQPGAAPLEEYLNPWRGKNPVTFMTGLQKSGTTLAGAVLAAGMGVSYQSEAVWDCCLKLGIDACAENADEFEQTYNFLPSGRFFSRNMHKFFRKCKDHTLLDTPREWQGQEFRPPFRVVKADDMLQDINTLATFGREQHLNMKLVFVVRHPLPTIRSTQSWIKHKQSQGKHSNWPTGVDELAHMWRKSARLYHDSPECGDAGVDVSHTPYHYECTFAALVRFEDLSARPHETVVALYKKLFPMSGGHFPMAGKNGHKPARETGLPTGWEERVTQAVNTQQTPYKGDYLRTRAVNQTFTGDELDVVGRKGGHKLMARFKYTMADVFDQSIFDYSD